MSCLGGKTGSYYIVYLFFGHTSFFSAFQGVTVNFDFHPVLQLLFSAVYWLILLQARELPSTEATRSWVFIHNG